ncbi:MAG TPA: alpha/beta hydrolase [Solirubrobacteraceae bacterium]
MSSATGLEIQTTDGVRLSGEQAGEGIPVVLAHGLTATRRYVVMGSRALERSGHRVVAYDARGHGNSTGAPDRKAYGYERLGEDLENLLDTLELRRAVFAGASMGAHTLLRLALRRPERVAALVLITPAYDPGAHARAQDERAYAGWDALARGLREHGVKGFLEAYDFSSVPDRWSETVQTVIDQRLSAHEHPAAVADALEVVPRSRPFESFEQLSQITVPTIVVGSRDEADPGHPLALAETYARLIPGAKLLLEEAGRSPIAWQGAQLSTLIADLADSIHMG